MEKKKYNPPDAKNLIIRGEGDGIEVDGTLKIKNKKIAKFPKNLSIKGSLDLENCKITELANDLSCYELNISGSSIKTLPEDIDVKFRINLSDCSELELLPNNLRVGTLILGNCTSLKALPEGLEVNYLDISGCLFSSWPKDITVKIGNLNMRNCINLTYLPNGLSNLTQLDLRECSSISELPEGLKVTGWIDIAGTDIKALPESLKEVQLRWKGVPIDERTAFNPETITSEEILEESNIEVRRVKLERKGFQTFLEEANAKIIDKDKDPGGERRLLKVDLEDDEPLVCLFVNCPSTGRQYVIRVPPNISSCHQAAAWVAGYDDPDEYNPILET